MRASNEDPSWTAPRAGDDWRDDVTLTACAWLVELADRRSWKTRIDAVRDQFLAAKEGWLVGRQALLHDPSDLAAWYIFQATAFANDRQNWLPEQSARIVPTMVRIGTELESLIKIPGAERCAARIMGRDRKQPDGGFLELLAALAWRRQGWEVEMLGERPGVARTPDLFVFKPRRRWAIECKRMGLSRYEATENSIGEAMAQEVHELSLSASRSIIVEVRFDEELKNLPLDYLTRQAEIFLANGDLHAWQDHGGLGFVRDMDWELAHSVLARDFVYYGSSRMIELLVGRYDHDARHSMAGKWRAHPGRPFWADAVYQASVVSWRSRSRAAILRKGKHFRSVVAKASSQLPGDRPGAVHVGVESWGGFIVDAARHIQNALEMRDFDPGSSRLRWVYGDYFSPEVTTRSDESWAVNETTAPYKIGRHSVPNPLPHHMLLGDETETRPGEHWDGLG